MICECGQDDQPGPLPFPFSIARLYSCVGGKGGGVVKQFGLFAGGVLTLAMFLAAFLAVIDRHLPVRNFGADTMEILGVFGQLIAVFYGLHLSLTEFLQSFSIVIEVLLLFVWFIVATRLLRSAMGR